VRECLGVTPDPWQDDVLEAFPKHQRLAMKACNGPGKTAKQSLARKSREPALPAESPVGNAAVGLVTSAGRQ